MDSEEALELNITVNEAGGGRVRVTMNDDRVEERLQLLNARGATRKEDTWTLETTDMGAFADAAEYIIKMVSDMLTPKETPGEARKATFERDDNTCRLCGANFDAPAIETCTRRINTRVLDHVYPQRDANPIHQTHEICNLVTVCGGCDDVFLQGDKFRIIVDQLGYHPTPLDRQLLAWVQKRGILRSDWMTDRLNENRGEDDQVEHELVVDRLRVLANLGLLEPLPDVANGEGFNVFALNIRHAAIAYLSHNAVKRHDRLPNKRTYVDDLDDEYIKMRERKSPSAPGVHA